MKKLVTIICCFLQLRSFAQSPAEASNSSEKGAGEKILIKAIAGFVNPNGNKKGPVKTVTLSAAECP
jgi:hypothetical protein